MATDLPTTKEITVDHSESRTKHCVSRGRMKVGEHGQAAVAVVHGCELGVGGKSYKYATVETPVSGLNRFTAEELREYARLLTTAASVLDESVKPFNVRTHDYNQDVTCPTCKQMTRTDRLFKCCGHWIDMNGKKI